MMDDILPARAQDESVRASDETILSPRFYTTDFAALERFDPAPVREEWMRLLGEFERDVNADHFTRDADFADEIQALPPDLHAEFLDFLVSSLTAEFSGCVLYSEIKRRVKNVELKRLMGYMARDEARHAGFLNQSLKDFGLGVDLGGLRREKKYTFFRPKFIYYATYLSEKIGYARYVSIFRHLERHPQHRFHPIFRWFERWCQDEFRHGEAFALMLRAEPGLLRGHNLWWIRFFLLAVFATMYVRDHNRAVMYRAFGMDITEFDREVFRITSEISKQVFPISLDLEHPKFLERLERLSRIDQAMLAARSRGGLRGMLASAALGLQAVGVFAALYFTPVHRHPLPASVRVAPAW